MSIENALNYIELLSKNNPLNKIHILVTGSLYLVGGVLECENSNILN